MSEHVFRARRQPGAPVSAQNAPPKAATVTTDPSRATDELDTLQAALNDTPQVRHTMQLRRSLSQSPHVTQLVRAARMVQRVPAAAQVVQRLELTEEMWTHIARGELRDNNKKLVGYHWTGDEEAIAEKNGTSKQGPNDIDVYVEGVQTKESFGKGKKAPIKKATPSTFWPDAWTEAEIKDAIANGGRPARNISEVSTKATKADARGMKLFVNPESVFPVYEPSEEQKESGRRGRGGKKR